MSSFFRELYDSAKKANERKINELQYRQGMREAACKGEFAITLHCDDIFAKTLENEGFVVTRKDTGIFIVDWKQIPTKLK